MGEILYYRALVAYDKEREDEMSFQKDDVIEVQKPLKFKLDGTEEVPTGWLIGKNTRTGETGCFLGMNYFVSNNYNI